MKGGFNNPPNPDIERVEVAAFVASMKGGFNNPPNAERGGDLVEVVVASMKGGFNNPPNRCCSPATAPR